MPGRPLIQPKRLVQSVDRAMQILKALAGAPDGLSLSALSRAVGLPAQTAQSLARTLQAHEMATQTGRGNPYFLGPAAQCMARQWLALNSRASLALPVARSLSERLGESVLLGELRGTIVVPLVDVQAQGPLIVSAEAHAYDHLHAMATGKILMAFLPEDQREEVIGHLDMRRRAPRSITTLATLSAELDAVRRRGYARSIEEGSVGVAAMAVPVRDAERVVIAALGISAPVARFGAARQRIVLPELIAASAEIEALWARLERGTNE